MGHLVSSKGLREAFCIFKNRNDDLVQCESHFQHQKGIESESVTEETEIASKGILLIVISCCSKICLVPPSLISDVRVYSMNFCH